MTSTQTKPSTTSTVGTSGTVEAAQGQYNPEVDSTPAHKKTARETGRVVLDLSGGACLCGCRGACKGRFQPGHDARLKGKLNRAAVAGVNLLVIIDNQRQETTPRQFATILTTAKHDWAAALDKAVEAAKKEAEAATIRKAESAKKAEERKTAAGEKGKTKISLDDFAPATK